MSSHILAAALIFCFRHSRRSILPPTILDRDLVRLRSIIQQPALCLAQLRVSSALFSLILEEFRLHISKSRLGRRKLLSPGEDLCLIMWYLAHGTAGVDLGLFSGLGRSTRSDHLRFSLRCLWRSLRRMPMARFRTPDGPAMSQYASMVRAQYPFLTNVVGFLDCTCVEIAKPPKFHTLYYDGHHAMYDIKGACVAHPDGTYSRVGVGFPGSTHDSRCAMHAGIYQELNSHTYDGFTVLADAGFSASTHIATPETIAGVSPSMCSSARVAIEWSFKQLKGRFRILGMKLRHRPRDATIILECCMRLSNLCSKVDGSSHLNTFFSS